MDSILIAAALSAGASALALYTVRLHSYSSSMLGFVVGSAFSQGPLGLTIAYLHHILSGGVQEQNLALRVSALGVGLCLPVLGLPLSLLLPLWLVITGCSPLYAVAFGIFSAVLSLTGSPSWVMVAMLSLSIFTSNYGESQLEATHLNNSSAEEEHPAIKYTRNRSKSNVVYGAAVGIAPLLGVSVSHTTLAAKVGLNANALVFLETSMDAYALKAVLSSSPYPMARTGLAEMLNNSTFSFQVVDSSLLVMLAAGVIVSLLLTSWLGVAPSQPQLERLCSFVSVGALAISNPLMLVTALAGAYVLSLIPGSKVGSFSTLPLINS